ncbi:hypothetical protein CLV46_1969 [Diaminobutyricimonas aerilata]|uniref:Uncharacterized protein n=1 Tax=Diaminobutyricimonas aerilata TaxID=1162967 RepID=A0A2M9CKI7_9MICO|nr:hypothetical protein CLV46_1969 [Diaminobutyricimonas aerilata]
MPGSWHPVRVSSLEPRWLTVPQLVEILGIGPGRIHRLLEERALLAIRRDGVLSIPESFIVDGHPMPELKGTLVVLADNGFDDAEAMQWLLEEDDALGTSPIAALQQGRKAEVRRVAQALAF